MKISVKVHFDDAKKAWMITIKPGVVLNLNDISAIMPVSLDGDISLDIESLEKATMVWTKSKG